jgi:hypothetical protein
VVRSNRHPAVVALPDFSFLHAAAVDHYLIGGRHLAVGDPFQFFLFLCLFIRILLTFLLKNKRILGL